MAQAFLLEAYLNAVGSYLLEPTCWTCLTVQNIQDTAASLQVELPIFGLGCYEFRGLGVAESAFHRGLLECVNYRAQRTNECGLQATRLADILVPSRSRSRSRSPRRYLAGCKLSFFCFLLFSQRPGVQST